MQRIFVLICLLVVSLGSFANNITSVRLWRSPEYTRLVFDVDAPVDYKVMTLSDPERIVIDLNNVSLKTSLQDISIAQTPIARVRQAKRGNNDLRVVLDLEKVVKPRSFMLQPSGDAGHRLVLDLNDISIAPPIVVETENAVQNAKRDIVVAIDAGHGGEDPGASGPSKTREKHVVLEIAKELKATIDGQPGFKAVLVRQGDYYVQHKRRWEIARENKADLFISIHADAFTDPRAKGSSVFALSRKGTTSAMARFLADSENVDLAGEVSLGDQEEMVAKTLTDLVMTSSLVASLDVGERIIGTMDDVTHLHSKRVELANFRVLKAPDVPSILIETGFISNPEEEKKLISKSHQRKLANAITEGVTSYFKSNPPMGTFLAWQREQTELNTHVVGRGESLTKIANSYGVTLDALKQANNLKKNTIHVGQKLRIPKG